MGSMSWYDDRKLLEYIREWMFWTIRIDNEAADNSSIYSDGEIIEKMANKPDFVAHSRIMMEAGITAKQAAEVGLQVAARERVKESMEKRSRKEDDSDDLPFWLK